MASGSVAPATIGSGGCPGGPTNAPAAPSPRTAAHQTASAAQVSCLAVMRSPVRGGVTILIVVTCHFEVKLLFFCSHGPLLPAKELPRRAHPRRGRRALDDPDSSRLV